MFGDIGNTIFDAITSRLSGAFSFIGDYTFLFEGYLLLLAVFGASIAVVIFFPVTQIRVALGVVVLTVLGYVVGMQRTWNRLRR